MERDNSTELNPVELNAQLRELLAQLPSNEGLPLVFENPLSIVENIKRRNRSEHKEIVVNQLGELLKHAKTSESFNKYLANEIQIGYGAGVYEDKAYDSSKLLDIVTDSDIKESEGIFGSRAKYIEYRTFEHAVKKRIDYRRMMRDMRSLNRKRSSDDTFFPFEDSEYEDEFAMGTLISQDLQDWIVDYMQHYPKPLYLQ